jgi:maleylacetate reductase
MTSLQFHFNSPEFGRYQGAVPQLVIYGVPVESSLMTAIRDLGGTRVLVVASSSLLGDKGIATKVVELLGATCVATVTNIRAHPPREDVIRIAQAIQEFRADTVVAIGGGSVIDASKAARLCDSNGVFSTESMDKILPPEKVIAPRIPLIAIPTTLSASEFTSGVGVTDLRGPRKQGFRHPSLAPSVVLLDPAMTLQTPQRLLLGTGMRAVDHAIETWCSIDSNPLVDAASLHALRLLPNGLRQCAAGDTSLENRLNCQIGAWLSIQGVVGGVNPGASHGIGHCLGVAAGMPHGETSCVLLPHVLRFNAEVNADRQSTIASVLGSPGDDLALLVHDLVKVLGLPNKIRDAGISRDILQLVAEESLHDRWVKTNPRPLRTASEVMDILESAW